MTADAVFGGTVKEGLLKLDLPARWRGLLGRLEGRRVEVVIRPERKHRSLAANAYLWGVVYAEIAAWSEHTDDEIHEAMKAKFLPGREVMFPTGEILPARSTKLLDSTEFSEYVSKVKLWAAEQGLRIPEPNEVEVSL
jgi:hypothetical protein